MKEQTFDISDYPVVLYDSQCLVCDGFVRFIIRYDKTGRLKFSGLQSTKSINEIQDRGIPIPENGTVVLVQEQTYHLESDAILEIMKIAGIPHILTGLILLVPKSWRDKVYRWVALNRYRIFPKRNYCPLPDPSQASRFI